MHIFAAILLVLGVIIWGAIVSRGFRIFVLVATCALGGWLMVLSNRGDQELRAKAIREQQAQAANQKRQQELWSSIRPDQIQLRDLALSRERVGNQFILNGAVKNLSNQKLGALDFAIVARDCLKDCEIVGRADRLVIWVDIPPGEVRALPGQQVEFAQLPEIKGKFDPQITLKRVYSGDILDQWASGR